MSSRLDRKAGRDPTPRGGTAYRPPAPESGSPRLSSPNGASMKRTVLFAFLFVFAGALVASARVEWIPTTRDEIIAYKQNEVEVVLVDLISYDTNGLLVVVS